jgi:hypothetical protein
MTCVCMFTWDSLCDWLRVAWMITGMCMFIWDRLCSWICKRDYYCICNEPAYVFICIYIHIYIYIYIYIYAYAYQQSTTGAPSERVSIIFPVAVPIIFIFFTHGKHCDLQIKWEFPHFSTVSLNQITTGNLSERFPFILQVTVDHCWWWLLWVSYFGPSIIYVHVLDAHGQEITAADDCCTFLTLDPTRASVRWASPSECMYVCMYTC